MRLSTKAEHGCDHGQVFFLAGGLGGRSSLEADAGWNIMMDLITHPTRVHSVEPACTKLSESESNLTDQIKKGRIRACHAEQ